MPPLTIRFDDALEAKLREEAEAASLTLSEFVRQLVVESLERRPKKETPYEAWERIYTGGTSGRSDLSKNRKKIIREMVNAKHRRRRRTADSAV
jgi:predicted transcriptional regulator